MSFYGHKYILVAVEYVSKWVEVMSLVDNEGKSLMMFLKKHFLPIWYSLLNHKYWGFHFCNNVFRATLAKFGV